MTLQPLLVDGQWRQSQSPVGTFTAYNPMTGQPLPDTYPISSADEIETVLRHAEEAVIALRQTSPETIANFLDAYAHNIEARTDALVEMAHQETALPKVPRLQNTELPRTVNQLRQAANAVRERSWCDATIDTKANICSKLGSLGGAVVIFGPNNFPYAFNAVSGGDFAVAIAAGNPVIAKAHPAHPGTSRLLAEAALEALNESELPPSTVQMVYHMEPQAGEMLVSHPLVTASSFTGSRAGGLKLKAAADRAGKLIYLEMSSINPVYFLPGVLTERMEKLVEEFATSCMLGTGQFCTNPGLVILLQDESSEVFLKGVASIFQTRIPGVLLAKSGVDSLGRAINTWRENGATLVAHSEDGQTEGYSAPNTLYRVSGADFLKNMKALQTEAFGPASLFVFAADEQELVNITRQLEGNLTGSIYSASSGVDDALYGMVETELRSKVGRLLNDKMPTGVAVSPAMNHGGPFPATNHPGFTAVGIPAAIRRFAALHCYDNVRQYRLPSELQDKNPTGQMWRYIDLTWTQADVSVLA